MKTALWLVDLQNDFCHGGALAVEESESVIHVANEMIAYCVKNKIAVIASQDWHPQDHLSFAVNSNKEVNTLGELNGLPQIWWPIHCVQNSHGAAFHPQLNHQAIQYIVYKGQNPQIDSYSAFYDNDHQHETLLASWLHKNEIKKLVVMGIATDYCVKFTVIDGLKCGFDVQVIMDGCKGVNLQPEDSNNAFAQMQQAGATLTTSTQFLTA